MPRNRFIEPKTVRLEISDGDWIEVKERLSYGEQQRLASGAFDKVSKLGQNEAEFSMDMERYNVLRLQTWIVDWSFVDARGKQVRVTPQAIAALDPDTVAEIDAALTAHIESLEAQKNAPETTSTG